MRDLDLRVIRVGEFTWSVRKPRKGIYDFSLFDFFLELAEEGNESDLLYAYGYVACMDNRALSGDFELRYQRRFLPGWRTAAIQHQ